jgi:hypothetical protein
LIRANDAGKECFFKKASAALAFLTKKGSLLRFFIRLLTEAPFLLEVVFFVFFNAVTGMILFGFLKANLPNYLRLANNAL